MERKAECACGQLSVTVSGDPEVVAICNCKQCQKRTGAPYGVSAYFNKAQTVAIEGARKQYNRTGEKGRQIEFFFCPECGSTVHWYAEQGPDWIGIAAGSFTDPDFPAPTWSVWTATKYKWVTFPEDINLHEDQPI
jgi:hypothetical protein